MSYKINPDAKYMMYDKPVESNYLRESIKNAVEMILNSEWTNNISIVMPKETYEILVKEIDNKKGVIDLEEILISDKLFRKLWIESEKKKISLEKLITDIIENHYDNDPHLNFVIENEIKNREINKK